MRSGPRESVSEGTQREDCGVEEACVVLDVESGEEVCSLGVQSLERWEGRVDVGEGGMSQGCWLEVVATGTEPDYHRRETRMSKNVSGAIRPCGFRLTNIPAGYASPIVPDIQAVGVVVGRQRAKRRGGDGDLSGAEANVPIDIIFDDQRCRMLTGEECSQRMEVTKPS